MPTVRVSVRVRPETVEQRLDPFKLDSVSGSISLTVAGHAHDFVFDEVFSQDASQEEVFNKSATEICKKVLDGYNGTVFAYGQTGAGKTHTMTGPAEIDNYEKDCGLCMRTASYLFAKSREMTDAVSIRLSILEIYNENLIDLLQPVPAASNTVSTTAQAQKLNVIEKPTGVSVPALRVMPLAHEEDAFAFMLDAHHNRVVAEHQLNRSSSRSHVLYTFYITIVRQQDQESNSSGGRHTKKSGSNEEPDPEVITSKLHLVDLAGSERSKKSGSDGSTMKEANYINRSLSYLEQVVVALTQVNREHIPYRQSKLTHILKDSLGGNCHTALISCVWPHRQHGWETLSTLRFATRMKNIENTPVRNSLVKPSEAGSGQHAQLTRQVNMLKKELIMRDTISGSEPFLTELTPKQKAATMKQACEIVGSHIPVAKNPASLFALLPPETVQGHGGDDLKALSESYYQSKLLHVDSLSQVHFLLGCMRAAVWEACDNDPSMVAGVLDRTMDAFREVYDASGPADPSRALPAFANIEAKEELEVANERAENQRAKASKEQWIYPSGMQQSEDEEGGAAGDVKVNLATGEDNENAQIEKSDSKSNMSKSADEHTGSSTLENLRRAGGNPGDYPQEQPDPFNERAEELTPASSIPKLPLLPQAMGSNGSGDSANGNGDGKDDHPRYIPAEHTLSFEEFKEGPGAALHAAYEDLRQHLKTEKGRMREITSLVNRKKAEIDQYTIAINDVDAKARDFALEGQVMENSLHEGGQIDNLDDETREALSKVKEEKQSLVMRMDQTKASYRALYMEFQLCRKQIEETQVLKKRAMNDIVSAYDRLAVHRPQPID